MSPSLSFFHFFPNISRHYPPIRSFPPLLLILLLLTTSSAAPPTPEASSFSEYILQNVFHHKDQCYKDSYVYIKESDAPEGAFTVFASTRDCSGMLRLEGEMPSELPNCPPGLVDLEVKPVYVARSQISYPYANLNISVTAHSSVETIVFRLECLAASDGTDVYCSNSKALFIDGVREWPCRAIHLSPLVRFPARFSYSCFRLTPHSIYTINATILPQRCRSVQLVTAPSFDDMFPEALIDPIYEEDRSTDPLWAPLLAVDLTDPSGVWVRLGKAAQAECDKMMVNVYREDSEDPSKVTFVQTLEVKCPDDGVLWENLHAGRYLLTAYVPIRGCQFHCNSGDKGCRQCLRTHLNVVFPESRASIPWLAYQKLKDSTFVIFVASIVICVLVALGGLIMFVVMWCKKRKEGQIVREIPLREYVQTMLVYADDGVEHQGVVRVLVENLRNCATCEPVFDVEKLITSEPIVPSRWLIDQVSTLPKFIIIMSDCAVRLLDTAAASTHHLVQIRPFADLFEPAMEMIIRDATHNGIAARQKYAVVRFAYSPPVPANLAILGLQTFNLPEQFGNLVAFLHDIPTDNVSINQILTQHRLQEWTRAVAIVEQQREQFPDWIEQRWRLKEEPVEAFQSTATRPALPLQTHEDRVKAAKQFGLHAPGKDSDEEEGPADETTFMLYPKKSGAVDSDSDSEAATYDPKDAISSDSPSPNNTAIYLGPGPPPGSSSTSQVQGEDKE